MKALIASMAVQTTPSGSEVTLPGIVQHHVKLFEELQYASSLVDTPPAKEARPASSKQTPDEIEREVERVTGVVRQRAQDWEERNHARSKSAEDPSTSSCGETPRSPLKREDEDDLLSAMEDLLRAAHELEVEYDRSFDHEHIDELRHHHSSECSHDSTIPEEEEDEEPKEEEQDIWMSGRFDDSAAALHLGVCSRDRGQEVESTEPDESDESVCSSRRLSPAETMMWADATRSAAASLQKQAEALWSLRFPSDAADEGTMEPRPPAAEQAPRGDDDVPGLMSSASLDLVDLAESVLTKLQDANRWARELSSRSREATTTTC